MKKQQRKRKIIKYISVTIFSIILIFSVLSMIAVKFIYDEQFPRYERHDETVTASLRYVDFKEEYDRQPVSFKSEDCLLRGYVYGSDNERGLVVLSHGLGGGADSYLPQIFYFVDQGWRVFAYDATGSFDSEGNTTKGFPQALIDLDSALAYIGTQPEFTDLPILLFGHSWGGYAVANVLHYDHDIAGVVTVSGVNSPMEIIIEQGKHMMGDFIYAQYPYLLLYQTLLFGKAAFLNAVDAINQSDVPVLIIHGIEDETVAFNGSSIISNIDDIQNPNVKIMVISRPGQSGHNNLFRSGAANEYINEINIQYKELFDSYEQNIPYRVRQEFYSKIDRNLAQDINRDLMDEIQAFYMECLG